MRNALMAMAALSLAIPVSMAVPTDGAQARKHYRYKEWRGRDGRTYCRKSDGTTGLIIGGVGGALVGRAIDTRGDRANRHPRRPCDRHHPGRCWRRTARQGNRQQAPLPLIWSSRTTKKGGFPLGSRPF